MSLTLGEWDKEIETLEPKQRKEILDALVTLTKWPAHVKHFSNSATALICTFSYTIKRLDDPAQEIIY